MAGYRSHGPESASRRRFLKKLGRGAVAGSMATSVAAVAAAAGAEGQVRYRTLGKTGLKVSEVGFGGHSWSYRRIPVGNGGLRRPTLDEAVEMIAAGLDMGVNFIDACTPPEEHIVPGQALKRLGKRDQMIISARCCHKMKGVPEDKEEVYKFVDQRLRMWQIDYFDLLMLTNTENDTPQSGLWDMSYCIEALAKVKEQGKVRFAGFGAHFTPAGFLYAFKHYAKDFEVVSLPYNIRHRVAEQLMPVAKKLGLGVVTIKPFARGSLLKGHEQEPGLARDMLAFVLENPHLDVCICGVHTIEQVRENFSASWTGLGPEARRRLEALAAATPCPQHRWLEEGWLHA